MSSLSSKKTTYREPQNFRGTTLKKGKNSTSYTDGPGILDHLIYAVRSDNTR